jgi:hypothetical protein
MLSDPIVATILGSSRSLARISDDGLTSVYQNSDRSLILTVSHQARTQKGGPDITGRMVRLDYKVVAADPLTAANKSVQGSVRVVFDDPDWGISDSDMKNLFTGLSNILAISGFQDALLADQH